MHKTAQKIITLFRNGNPELSTSQIVAQINKNYSKLKDNKDKEEIAKLHRRTLHHLNKLVNLEILRVLMHGEKGEKFFSLNVEDDAEIVDLSSSYKKRLLTARITTPQMPIEGYEQKEIVIKYAPSTWIDRLNSIIIFSEKIPDKDKLQRLILEKAFPVVNDVINIENFETIIDKQDTADFLKKLDEECEYHGKILSFTVNLTDIKNINNFTKIINLISKLKHINFIFPLTSLELEENFGVMLKLVKACIKNKSRIYIKNKRIQKTPHFVGRGGPYCFKDKDWSLAEELRKDVICLGCSQSTAIVDVNKFYSEYGLNIKKFTELLINIAKSLLAANTIQRRKAGEYLKSIISSNKGHETEFLTLSRNYIRFWNFGLNQPGMHPEFALQMINEAKKKISEFASAEETIYRSCGMPVPFKLALSCAFSNAARLSPAKFTKLEIKNFDSYKKLKQILVAREETCRIFDGGNDVTFHYLGELKPKNIIGQIKMVLLDYDIPLFNYSFGGGK